MSYTYTDKIRFANTTNFDSFGRLRVSDPYTLFDSNHRHRDNGKWSQSTSGNATAVFNNDQGLVDMTIGSISGDEIIRETSRVFSYQPGKSLLTMNTFVMEEAKVGLRQRIGYFGVNNGTFLEQDDTQAFMVLRSYVTGSTVDTKALQSEWNTDKMDGTGPSGHVLDLTKAQILWSDFEWLGVGSVRMGLVIGGEFITCHIFHHANIIMSTYMTTANLPIRYEITNTAANSGPNTLKQICSTVISEGEYELRGTPRTVNIPITTSVNLQTAGTYYPVISIRLKSTALDGIVLPSHIDLQPETSAFYSYRLVSGGTTTGGTWSSAGTDSIVEYNITGTDLVGGNIGSSGFVSQTNQSRSTLSLDRTDIFCFQLERNPFTSTPKEFTLLVSASGNNNRTFASIGWEEVSN